MANFFNTVKIMLSNSAANLRTALSEFGWTATVEAEYGDQVVEGNVVTLAHHGPRSGNPCPCTVANMTAEVEAIGVSHFDLDTLGGVLAVVGRKPSAFLFWRAAALVDTMGAHKLQSTIKNTIWRESVPQMGTDEFRSADADFQVDWEFVIDELHAFWAWSEAHRLVPDRDGSARDVTEFFEEAAVVLDRILEEGDEELLQAGKVWFEAKEALDKASFVREEGGVILRTSGEFVNHLYGEVGRAIVAFGEKFSSITISLSDHIPGVSCREIVQGLWGADAGGHDGIAGSPRGRIMTMEEAEEAFSTMVKLLK